MSSTKRGGQRSPADNYPTPGWCIRRFLEVFVVKHLTPNALNTGVWLEPGAGEGNLIRSVNEWFESQGRTKPVWDANELRPDCIPWLSDLEVRNTTIGDFIANGSPTEGPYDLTITNPPFSITMEFIRRSLKLNTRYVVMLQRLNYIGSEIRHAFMQECPPDLYVIPNRVSFKASGKADSVEYAWFVWDKFNLHRDHGAHTMLALTSKEERKKDREYMQDIGIFPEPEPASNEVASAVAEVLAAFKEEESLSDR